MPASAVSEKGQGDGRVTHWGERYKPPRPVLQADPETPAEEDAWPHAPPGARPSGPAGGRGAAPLEGAVEAVTSRRSSFPLEERSAEERVFGFF